MGGRCGKAAPSPSDASGDRASTTASTTAAATIDESLPTLMLLGLSGAGKSALAHALAHGAAVAPASAPSSPRVGGGLRRDDDDEEEEEEDGVLCAPPRTTVVATSVATVAGARVNVVDVPGNPPRASDGLGGSGGDATARAWRDAIARYDPRVVVFVVDAADELRAPLAREELWALCGCGAGGGGGDSRERLVRGRRLVVVANKRDVDGAMDADEVADALDLDALALELGGDVAGTVACECASAAMLGGPRAASAESALRGVVGAAVAAGGGVVGAWGPGSGGGGEEGGTLGGRGREGPKGEGEGPKGEGGGEGGVVTWRAASSVVRRVPKKAFPVLTRWIEVTRGTDASPSFAVRHRYPSSRCVRGAPLSTALGPLPE